MVIILLLLAQIEIKAELDKNYQNKELTIGDPFVVDLILSYPQGTDVSAPFVDSIEPFVVLDQHNKTIQKTGRVINTYNMKLVAFSTGDLEIPVFKFLYRHDDTSDTLTSNAVGISIASVMDEDMSDINDIKKAVEYPDYLPLIIAGIIVICILAGYFVYRFIKTVQKARIIARPLPPPWIEAIAAIDNMPIKEWLEKGLVKRYYYALSEVLKRYIARRFEFNAAEQTTTELVYNMKLAKIPARDDFTVFFTRADMVKYAKFIPPKEESQMAAQNAKSLVNRTKPEETSEGK
jgi:hypothetical protein